MSNYNITSKHARTHLINRCALKRRRDTLANIFSVCYQYLGCKHLLHIVTKHSKNVDWFLYRPVIAQQKWGKRTSTEKLTTDRVFEMYTVARKWSSKTEKQRRRERERENSDRYDYAIFIKLHPKPWKHTNRIKWRSIVDSTDKCECECVCMCIKVR